MVLCTGFVLAFTQSGVVPAHVTFSYYRGKAQHF